MTATPETFKAAWIEDLKEKPTVVAIVGNEIRENEYQASDWVYPCIRVSLSFKPAINRCFPNDGDVDIDIYSAEKSSKQAAHLASLVYELYHGHPFESAGIRFSTVIVREVTKPDRSVFAWVTTVKVFCQGI